MAERLTSSGARDLDFISGNPAMDAYNEGQKIARHLEASDLANEAAARKNLEDRLSAGTRLRKIDADTRTAVAGADVAQGTVGSKIASEAAGAKQKTADANVAAGTVGSRIAKSGYEADTAGSNAVTAASNSRVAVGTEPYKIDDAYQTNRQNTSNANVAAQTEADKVAQSGSQTRLGAVNADIAEGTKADKIKQQGSIATRQQNANAINAELASVYKQVELLNAGQIDAAQEVARQSGHAIPEALLQSAEARTAMTRAIEAAKMAYPNRPRDQMTFIKGFIEDMAKRRSAGQNVNDPTAPYNVTGAPTPPEDNTADKFTVFSTTETGPDGKPVVKNYNHSQNSGEVSEIKGVNGALTRPGAPGAAGGGRTSVFQQKQAAWLEAHPGDTQGALEFANNRKTMQAGDIIKVSLQMAAKEIANNQTLRFKNQAEQSAAVNKRAMEIQQQLQAGYTPPSAPAAAPPSAPAAGKFPPAPVNPAERQIGQVYTAPNGRNGRWTGQGWEIVQ